MGYSAPINQSAHCAKRAYVSGNNIRKIQTKNQKIDTVLIPIQIIQHSLSNNFTTDEQPKELVY